MSSCKIFLKQNIYMYRYINIIYNFIWRYCWKSLSVTKAKCFPFSSLSYNKIHPLKNKSLTLHTNGVDVIWGSAWETGHHGSHWYWDGLGGPHWGEGGGQLGVALAQFGEEGGLGDVLGQVGGGGSGLIVRVWVCPVTLLDLGFTLVQDVFTEKGFLHHHESKKAH